MLEVCQTNFEASQIIDNVFVCFISFMYTTCNEGVGDLRIVIEIK